MRHIVLFAMAVATAFWLAPAFHVLPQHKKVAGESPSSSRPVLRGSTSRSAGARRRRARSAGHDLHRPGASARQARR